MGCLDGKVALVTGGSSGIGAAACRALAAEGAAVVVSDVADEAGEALAAELAAGPARALYVHLDVTDEAEWQAAVERTERELGRLDVLVLNAGIATLPDVETETREGYDRLIAVNQTGVFLGMKTGAPALKRSGGGSIVNVSSIFGAVAGFGASIAYHASKGAVRLMTKNAAVRWAKEGIRVNSIHPAFIETPLLEPVEELGLMDTILSSTPMGRLGRPDEVAQAIVFLACDARSSYVTGSELYVDGGWTAQ